MDESSRAVLAAADRWLSAAQAMTDADEAHRRTEDEDLDLDDAEMALAGTVLGAAAGQIIGPKDLRDRVVGSVAAGRSCRATATLFGVSVASVVKWSQRWRATGSAAATTIRSVTSPLDRLAPLPAARPRPGA